MVAGSEAGEIEGEKMREEGRWMMEDEYRTTNDGEIEGGRDGRWEVVKMRR